MVLNFTLTDIGKIALADATIGNQLTLQGVIITNGISSLNVTTPQDLTGSQVFTQEISGVVENQKVHVEFSDLTENFYSAKTVALTFIKNNTIYVFALSIPEEGETELFYKSIAPLVASIDLKFDNAENITFNDTNVLFPDASTTRKGKVRLATQQEIENKSGTSVVTADGLTYLNTFDNLLITNKIRPTAPDGAYLGDDDYHWEEAYINAVHGKIIGSSTGFWTITPPANEFTISLNANECWESNTAIQTNGLIGPFAKCNTASNIVKKEITLPGFKLAQGAVVHIQFTNRNTAQRPTLSINNGTAFEIKFMPDTPSGTDEFTSWDSGSVVELVYDGTYWINQRPLHVSSAYHSQYTNNAYSVISEDTDGTLIDLGYWTDEQDNSYETIRAWKDIVPYDDLDIGKEDYPWINVWAGTFHGNLDGNSTTATYSQYIGTNSTNKVATYTYSNATTRALIPSVNYSSSSYVNLGNSSTKWGYLYCHQIGTSTSGNEVSSAYITNVYGTLGSSSSRQNVWADHIYFNTTTSTAPVLYRDSTTLKIKGSIAPELADTYSLGSSNYRWDDIHSLMGHITNYLYLGGHAYIYSTFSSTTNNNETVYINYLHTNASIYPTTNANLNIGESNNYWNNLYTKNIIFNSATYPGDYYAESKGFFIAENGYQIKVDGDLIPSTSSKFKLGDSTSPNHLWQIYGSSYNIVFLCVTIYANQSDTSTHMLSYNSYLSATGITAIKYANLHFLIGGSLDTAYITGSDEDVTGSFKVLTTLKYWLDGGTRRYILPAIKIS